jgi:hypothetical protein
MSQPDTPSQDSAYDVGHTHPDVSGGWLRAATYLLGLLVAAVI